MVDRGGEFSFFQRPHVKIDIRIDIFITINPIITVIPMITKIDKQVHLQDLTHMRLIKQVLVASLRQDCVTD